MRLVGILCGAVLLLAACGGESDPDTTFEADATATTTIASPAASGEAVPMSAAPCSLVTADEVSSATGLTVVESGEASPTSCVYEFGDEAGVAIFVSTDDGEGGFLAPSSVFTNYMALVDEGGAEMIPGVGAAAVYDQDLRGLAVDAGGGRFIALGVNGGYGELTEPRDVLVELATLAVGRL